MFLNSLKLYPTIFGESFAVPLQHVCRAHQEFISAALGLKINTPVNEKWTNLRLEQTMSVKVNPGKKYGRSGDVGENRMWVGKFTVSLSKAHKG